MYIYLTVSAIQIAFFIAYCSCLSRQKKLEKCQKELEVELMYEENYQKVLEQLRKNRYNPQFYKNVRKALDKLSVENDTENLSDGSDWSNNPLSIFNHEHVY